MTDDRIDDFRHTLRQRTPFGSAGGAVAPLLVVGGGQPGVGTTTIAANLAVALARQGRRAVLVDADLERGGQGLFGSQAAGSLLDVLSGQRTVHEALDRGPSGIQLLAGIWNRTDVAEFSPQSCARLIANLQHLAPHAEVLVVDAGNGRNALAKLLWQAASAVMAVTTPEDTAIVRCYAAIKLYVASEQRPPIHTLVNQVADAAIAADVQARLGEACRRFLSLSAIAAPHVPRCEADGTRPLLFPVRGEEARQMDRAADLLWSHLQHPSSEMALSAASRRSG